MTLPAVGKPSREQAEIARLCCKLGVKQGRLEQTGAAMEVMRKLSAFFEKAVAESPYEPRSTKK